MLMEPERWQQIDELLKKALGSTPADRESLLRQEDATTRDEVSSLLKAHERADCFLETPALDALADSTAADDFDDKSWHERLVGARFSHYLIIEKLGQGGMGVVFKAEDTRLERLVALKFISVDVNLRTESASRFRGEARAASALNHPGICTIYDIGEIDGEAFIAMEYLEGNTLRECISSASLNADSVLALAIEICEALHSAHERGIIHRDIKPANIFITGSGHAKILDFGLAQVGSRLIGDEVAPEGQSVAAGVSHTGAGLVAGTPAYMSPEQKRGERLDGRTDLFSFGKVVGEMAGACRFDTSREQKSFSVGIAAIVHRATQAALDARYQRAADLCADLRKLQAKISTRFSVTTKFRKFAIASILALLLAAVLVYRVERPAKRLSVLSYRQLTHDGLAKQGGVASGAPPAALVTNGAKVFFTEGPPATRRIAKVSSAGGPTAEISTPMLGPRFWTWVRTAQACSPLIHSAAAGKGICGLFPSSRARQPV